MDFYGVGMRGATLALNEGAVRLDCPPGTVKVYLPDFPWEECVPEAEMLEPSPAELPPELPAALPAPIPEPLPEPFPSPLPQPLPATPPSSGQARFLRMDAAGNVLDPDTGEIIQDRPAVLAFSTAETAVTAIGALGAVAIILIALGIIK